MRYSHEIQTFERSQYYRLMTKRYASLKKTEINQVQRCICHVNMQISLKATQHQTLSLILCIIYDIFFFQNKFSIRTIVYEISLGLRKALPHYKPTLSDAFGLYCWYSVLSLNKIKKKPNFLKRISVLIN